MHVEVTEDDIREGRRREPCRCAVARAVLRAIDEQCGRQPDVHVHAGQLTITLYRSRTADSWTVATPIKVAEWMTRFDRCADVSPFEFFLALDAEAALEAVPSVPTGQGEYC